MKHTREFGSQQAAENAKENAQQLFYARSQTVTVRDWRNGLKIQRVIYHRDDSEHQGVIHYRDDSESKDARQVTKKDTLYKK